MPRPTSRGATCRSTRQSPQHLPDSLAKATVAVADPDFWSHGGYVLSGWNDPTSHPTLAQKLVSDLLLYSEAPSLRRALRERILAAQATMKYGRTQILEWVLNSADYGNDAFGAEAAAQLYFGKPAIDLTLAESALLAATAESPTANPIDARDAGAATPRQDHRTDAHAVVRSPQGKRSRRSPRRWRLFRRPPQTADPAAPAFVHLVRSQLDQQFARERIERGGVTITTTLDYDLQQQATCTSLTFVRRLEGAADPSTPCPAADRLPRAAAGNHYSRAVRQRGDHRSGNGRGAGGRG